MMLFQSRPFPVQKLERRCPLALIQVNPRSNDCGGYELQAVFLPGPFAERLIEQRHRLIRVSRHQFRRGMRPTPDTGRQIQVSTLPPVLPQSWSKGAQFFVVTHMEQIPELEKARGRKFPRNARAVLREHLLSLLEMCLTLSPGPLKETDHPMREVQECVGIGAIRPRRQLSTISQHLRNPPSAQRSLNRTGAHAVVREHPGCRQRTANP